MPSKLSPSQGALLVKMRGDPMCAPGAAGRCAYTLRTSLYTLDALKARGLVERCETSDLGTMFSPRTSKLYRLTEEGAKP